MPRGAAEVRGGAAGRSPVGLSRAEVAGAAERVSENGTPFRCRFRKTSRDTPPAHLTKEGKRAMLKIRILYCGRHEYVLQKLRSSIGG